MKLNVFKLELLIAEKGLNYKQFAKIAKVSRQQLSTIRGRGTCQTDTAFKLSKALQVPLTTIIKED